MDLVQELLKEQNALTNKHQQKVIYVCLCVWVYVELKKEGCGQ